MCVYVMGGGGGGYSDIFKHTYGLDHFLVQNFEIQYLIFFGRGGAGG